MRSYRSADALACCEVINRAVEEMDGLNDAARRLVSSRNVPDVFDAELGRLYTVVCEIGGSCVGVGALDGTEIRRVYVDPSAQGLGVGDSIVTALESEARQRGVVQVRLEASPSSVSFYEARGYTPDAEQRLLVGGAEFRVIPMSRRLSDTEDRPSIRAFAPDDWDAICALYEPAVRSELVLTGIDSRAFRPLPEEEDLETFQRRNSTIVACVGGRVAGFAAWRERGEWRESGYLSMLYVDPAYHRRGIGDRLLSQAIAALGDQAWTLTKLGNNPAISLYQKHGMQIVTTRPADTWGYPCTELRLAMPTSRKFDADVPNFGA